MVKYLLDHGMTWEEFCFFLESKIKAHCVMGNDYYVSNEHRVYADGRVVPSGEIFGYYVLTRQYYDRYKLPVMHTETNIAEDFGFPGKHREESETPEPGSVQWLHKEWANMLRLKRDGVPVLGFTWYSLTDQVDWDTALREDNGRINPLGLYDLDRNVRAVGEAYRQLIAQWRAILPTERICLHVG